MLNYQRVDGENPYGEPIFVSFLLMSWDGTVFILPLSSVQNKILCHSIKNTNMESPVYRNV